MVDWIGTRVWGIVGRVAVGPAVGTSFWLLHWWLVVHLYCKEPMVASPALSALVHALQLLESTRRHMAPMSQTKQKHTGLQVRLD